MAGLANSVKNGNRTKMDKSKVGEVVGYLLMSRDYTHKAHLKTSSYSTHVALNELYTELLEFTDEFAEVAQGMFGKLDIPEYRIEGNINDPISALQKHVNTLMSMVDTCEARALNKTVDEIAAVYYRTLYKISELS